MTFEEMEAKTTPEPTSGCWLWTGRLMTKGYGMFSVNRRPVSAHRHMLFLATGQRPQVVMHKCDNRACVNPEHLQAGTQRDNMRDMARKGRAKRCPSLVGEEQHTAKLTAADVIEIRKMRAAGVSQSKVGERFGVKQACISKIDRGLAWTHVVEEWR